MRSIGSGQFQAPRQSYDTLTGSSVDRVEKGCNVAIFKNRYHPINQYPSQFVINHVTHKKRSQFARTGPFAICHKLSCRNRISIKSKHFAPLVFKGLALGETLDGKRKGRKNPPLLSCHSSLHAKPLWIKDN